MSNVPKHITIIMDGNGRWAKQRGLERLFGHRAGKESVSQACEYADNPHEVLLTYLQNDIDHSGDEGEYFERFLHSLSSVEMTV